MKNIELSEGVRTVILVPRAEVQDDEYCNEYTK